VTPRSERALVALLRAAYSGEKGAALAYRGHARSVGDPLVRAAIERIEEEEWAHRQLVGEMLRDLGGAPGPMREAVQGAIGRTLGALCGVFGWTLPMLGAWILERWNVSQYARAAEHADAIGRFGDAKTLRRMSDVEVTHARFFREAALGAKPERARAQPADTLP
jgi:demethoxyubiquinone hydroxylase (CLK1/Coq7/Cat5 family)